MAFPPFPEEWANDAFRMHPVADGKQFFYDGTYNNDQATLFGFPEHPQTTDHGNPPLFGCFPGFPLVDEQGGSFLFSQENRLTFPLGKTAWEVRQRLPMAHRVPSHPDATPYLIRASWPWPMSRDCSSWGLASSLSLKPWLWPSPGRSFGMIVHSGTRETCPRIMFTSKLRCISSG